MLAEQKDKWSETATYLVGNTVWLIVISAPNSLGTAVEITIYFPKTTPK
jgi:hypothetical protein